MNTGPLNLTTQDVYRPIETLQEQHTKAMTALSVAVTRGDTKAMKAAFDKIVWIVEQENLAYRNLNQYVLSKVHHERNDQ